MMVAVIVEESWSLMPKPTEPVIVADSRSTFVVAVVRASSSIVVATRTYHHLCFVYLKMKIVKNPFEI